MRRIREKFDRRAKPDLKCVIRDKSQTIPTQGLAVLAGTCRSHGTRNTRKVLLIDRLRNAHHGVHLLQRQSDDQPSFGYAFESIQSRTFVIRVRIHRVGKAIRAPVRKKVVCDAPVKAQNSTKHSRPPCAGACQSSPTSFCPANQVTQLILHAIAS